MRTVYSVICTLLLLCLLGTGFEYLYRATCRSRNKGLMKQVESVVGFSAKRVEDTLGKPDRIRRDGQNECWSYYGCDGFGVGVCFDQNRRATERTAWQSDGTLKFHSVIVTDMLRRFSHP